MANPTSSITEYWDRYARGITAEADLDTAFGWTQWEGHHGPGRELLGVPKSALDLGCGRGVEVAALARAGVKAEGIDLFRTGCDGASSARPSPEEVEWVLRLTATPIGGFTSSPPASTTETVAHWQSTRGKSTSNRPTTSPLTIGCFPRLRAPFVLRSFGPGRHRAVRRGPERHHGSDGAGHNGT